MSLFGNSPRPELQYKQDEGTETLRAFVGKSIISGTHELDRIVRYQLYWHFYNGMHWREYNHTFLTFNYVRAFIDKVNQFLLGKDCFSLEVRNFEGDSVPVEDEEIEKAAEKLIINVWNKNKKKVIVYEMFQTGGVTGDLWVLTEWSTQKNIPLIKPLDSRHCFPEFTNGDISRLEKFVLRQPLEKNAQDFRVMVTEFTNDNITRWYQKDTEVNGKRFNEKEEKNTYGFIPITHIKNKPNSDGYYSISDARDIMKLNKVYNELAQELKGIIDYHVAPTTVITGGSAKTLRKGVGNIWSGLPSDANVFNLGLDADLSASTAFMQTIKTNMHELSDVPENALGKIQAISNTSAAAIQLTFQPLVHQANLKWLTYGEGITEINTNIVKLTRKFDPENELLNDLPTDFEDSYMVVPIFPYGFPQDRMAELQQIEIELRTKIASRKEVMNRLGKTNVPALLDEIDEDPVNIAEEQNGPPTDSPTGDDNLPE